MSTAAHDAHPTDAEHAHNPHLAHHFDTPEQQFSTGKLGMWTFLATEILMFGGLFCAYAVYRYNHPQVYLWAHHALDATMGMINTIVLLASSFTMAWGVRAAQLNQRGLLKLMLILTFLGGVVFMGVKTVEYNAKWKHFLFPGKFNSLNARYEAKTGEDPAADKAFTIKYVESHMGGHHHEEGAEEGVEKTGLEKATDNGTAGHGTEGEVKNGGAVNPASEHNPQVAAGATEHQSATSQPVQPAEAMVQFNNLYHDGQAGTPDAANVLPPSFTAAGINPDADRKPGHTWTTYAQLEPTDRAQLNTFFSIYFMMTGLHGVHVIVGMGLIAWLYIRASRGDFSSEYFTPVDLGGLYWHLVDLIWIFLFPLLYLIH